MWWLINTVFLGLAVLLLPHFRSKIQFDIDYTSFKESDSKQKDCVRVGEGIVGPEDIAYSKLHNVMFISSNAHRERHSRGSLFFMDAFSQSYFELETDYPPDFSPHGMSLYEDEHISRLFVVSHRLVAGCAHAIEVFDLDIDVEKHLVAIVHVTTLCSELLTSPNDVLAMGPEELLVSNDHGSEMMSPLSVAQGLLEDTFFVPRAAMAYFNGFVWQALGEDSPAAFGNGLAVQRSEDGQVEYLYRASSANYELQKFELRRGYDNNRESRVFGAGSVFHEAGGSGRGGGSAAAAAATATISGDTTGEEAFASATAVERSRRSLSLFPAGKPIKLPISPDNIEVDHANPGSLLIAGHPSTALFMAHALLPSRRSPSAVLRFDTYTDTAPNYVYMDDGSELSGSSVCVRALQAHSPLAVGTNTAGQALATGAPSGIYIGQVFNPYLLYCPQ